MVLLSQATDGGNPHSPSGARDFSKFLLLALLSPWPPIRGWPLQRAAPAERAFKRLSYGDLRLGG